MSTLLASLGATREEDGRVFAVLRAQDPVARLPIDAVLVDGLQRVMYFVCFPN